MGLAAKGLSFFFLRFVEILFLLCNDGFKVCFGYDGFFAGFWRSTGAETEDNWEMSTFCLWIFTSFLSALAFFNWLVLITGAFMAEFLLELLSYWFSWTCTLGFAAHFFIFGGFIWLILLASFNYSGLACYLGCCCYIVGRLLNGSLVTCFDFVQLLPDTILLDGLLDMEAVPLEERSTLIFVGRLI